MLDFEEGVSGGINHFELMLIICNPKNLVKALKNLLVLLKNANGYYECQESSMAMTSITHR